MGIATLLYTFFKGSQVGTDAAGNRYFIERRRPAKGVAARRWVIYRGSAAASSVPAGWHAWLHFQTPAATGHGIKDPGGRA